MKVGFPSLLLLLSMVLVCSLVLPTFHPSAQSQPRIESSQRQLTRDEKIKILPSKNKRWALVIGVDDYSDPQITKLSGASNDAHKVAEALTKYAGFPEDQVILLASDQPPALQPRRSTVLRFLSNLRGTVPKDGLLLVSFAGHGIERGGRAFLLPSDALGVNDMVLLEDTAVSVDRIKESIRATGVGQVILILDACRSDPESGRSVGDNLMTSEFRKSFNFDQRNEDIRAFATLYATAVGERSYEYDVKKQGYFTWALVEGLRGAAANDRGEVTLQRLVDYLQNNVPRLVQRDLGRDKHQQPFANIEGYLAADLVIAVAPSGPTSSSTPAPAAYELSYWESIKSSTDPHDFEAYLQRYPNGQFVELARNNLSRLRARSNSNSSPQSSAPTRAKAGKILLNVTLKQERGSPAFDAELTATFLEILSSANLGITDISSLDTKSRTRLLSSLESLRAGYAVISDYELVIDSELVLNDRVASGADGMFVANIGGLLRVFDCAIGRAVITKNLSFRGFGLSPSQAITNAKRNVREGLTEEVLGKISDYAK
ncbi:MAG TPA: caspase family protein [Pyrinomonadaceae bacterium]|nr:caspase family protein [Pyrinomonadaceae bacterium]